MQYKYIYEYIIYIFIIIEKIHTARDPAEINKFLLLAEDFYSDQDTYDALEKKRRKKEIKKIRDNYSMQPLQSAFFDLPMGHTENHVGKSGSDILHFFLSGLCKNAVSYVLIICHQISKLSVVQKFTQISKVLEERIMCFPIVFESLPHVQWTYFRSGLVNKLVEHMTSANKSRNTGKGGGFRSAHFLPALMQLYFCLIGILPTDKKFKISRSNRNGLEEIAELGDVNSTVFDAIENLLHFYFEICRGYWDSTIHENFSKMIPIVRKSYLSLWKLKQLSIFSDLTTSLKGLKLHALDHFPETISNFSCPDGWDTPYTESFHKIFKAIWKTLSRRTKSEELELMTQILLKRIEQFYNDKCLFLKGNYASTPLSKNMKVDEQGDTKFSFGVTTKKNYIYLDLGESFNTFCVKGEIDRNIFNQFQIKFSVFEKKLESYLQGVYENIADISCTLKLFQRPIVTITGSTETGVGKVLLHAYTNKKSERYDFIEVSVGENELWLAQVLGLFQVVSDNSRSQTLFFIKYLENVDGKEKTKSSLNRSDIFSTKSVCSKYRWRAGIPGETFDTAIISQDCVANVAFVVPCHMNASKQIREHIFYYIPRKFFDRTGWFENVSVIETSSFNDTQDSKGKNKNKTGFRSADKNSLSDHDFLNRNLELLLNLTDDAERGNENDDDFIICDEE